MNNTWSLFFFKFSHLFSVQILPSFYLYLLHRDRSDRQTLVKEKSSICSIANQHSLLRTITAALFQGLVKSNCQQTKLISEKREKRENRKSFHWVVTGIQTFAVSSLKKFGFFRKCHVHSYLQMNSDCFFLPYNSS